MRRKILSQKLYTRLTFYLDNYYGKTISGIFFVYKSYKPTRKKVTGWGKANKILKNKVLLDGWLVMDWAEQRRDSWNINVYMGERQAETKLRKSGLPEISYEEC